jgi:hypothetical protein
MALFTYFLAGNKTRITVQAAVPSGKGSLETGYSVGKWRSQCDGERTGGGRRRGRVSSGPSFVFGGQHCEEILITQGRIVWEEIVKPVLGWLRRGFWAPTEQVLQILILRLT